MPDLRPEQAIRAEEQRLIDYISYDNHRARLDLIGHFQEEAPAEDELDRIGEEMRAIEARYGTENLRPLCEHTYERVCGQLDALSWVLGDLDALSMPEHGEGGDEA